MSFYQQSMVLGNDLLHWALALAAAGALLLLLLALRRQLLRRLGAWAASTATRLDDVAVAVLAATRLPFLLVLALAGASLVLTLTPLQQTLVWRVLSVALMVQGALWGDTAISRWLGVRLEAARAGDAASVTSTAALAFVARAALWVLFALMALDNLGFNIATLIASLGIGGIAVALALQNILGDIFASLSIVLDKPFAVGDFVTVDQVAGTVEYIGLKTTRLRSISGEQIVCSNADLLKSRIRNYKRMQERRVLFSLGLLYQSTPEQLEAVPGLVRAAVEAQSDTRFERAHLKGFGESSLDFEVVYYVTVPDYGRYMDVQQGINLALVRSFAAAGIGFAYPSRTLYMAAAGAQ